MSDSVEDAKLHWRRQGVELSTSPSIPRPIVEDGPSERESYEWSDSESDVDDQNQETDGRSFAAKTSSLWASFRFLGMLYFLIITPLRLGFLHDFQVSRNDQEYLELIYGFLWGC